MRHSGSGCTQSATAHSADKDASRHQECQFFPFLSGQHVVSTSAMRDSASGGKQSETTHAVINNEYPHPR